MPSDGQDSRIESLIASSEVRAIEKAMRKRLAELYAEIGVASLEQVPRLQVLIGESQIWTDDDRLRAFLRSYLP